MTPSALCSCSKCCGFTLWISQATSLAFLFLKNCCYNVWPQHVAPSFLQTRQILCLGVERKPRLLDFLCSSRLCFQSSHQLIQVGIYGRISLGSDCRIFCRNWAKSYGNKSSHLIRAVLLLISSVNQFQKPLSLITNLYLLFSYFSCN